MPVIIVGADTAVGDAIVNAVVPNAVEVRTFISDEARVDEFKRRGTKVATGDVSDASHIEGASLRCFCAVLVIDAATDDRERAFAQSTTTTLAGWATAIRNSGVKRAIWVGVDPDSAELPDSVAEVAVVVGDDDLLGVAQAVARLEDAEQLPG